MHTLLQDIRHGMRSLARQPVYLLVAVFTLALGIGANTAVFSVVYAVLLRPLPYPDAKQVVFVRGRTVDFPKASICLPDFLDCRNAGGPNGRAAQRVGICGGAARFLAQGA